MRKEKRSRLSLKKDRLRVLSAGETEQVHGGDPPYTHGCFHNTHPNCPNDSRYCL
jgi:hypothetical protein